MPFSQQDETTVADEDGQSYYFPGIGPLPASADAGDDGVGQRVDLGGGEAAEAIPCGSVGLVGGGCGVSGARCSLERHHHDCGWRRSHGQGQRGR